MNVFLLSALLSLSLVNASSLTSDEELKREIVSACSSKLDFKHISQFEQFLSHYKELLERKSLWQELANAPDGNAAMELTKRCLVEKEAILALGRLIVERERPCKPDNIELLMDLAKFWLVDYKQNPITNGKRSIINNFFTLYSVELAYQCKRHLLAHLGQADELANPLDFVRVLSTPLGWEEIMREHSRKAMKFGKSTTGRNDVVNKLSALIPGLRRIEHMDLVIEEPDAIVTTGVTHTAIKEDEFSEYKITHQAYNYLTQIIESCRNLEQFYLANIMSLARLQQLGLVFDMGQIDEHHDASASMHKWLAVTSFCQTFSMVQMEQIEAPKDDDEPSSIVKMKARILKDVRQAKHRRRYYTYVAPIKEIGDFARDKAWLVTMGTRGGLVRNVLETGQELYHGKLSSDGKKKTRQVVQTNFEQYLKALQADLGSPITLESDKQVEAITEATLFGNNKQH